MSSATRPFIVARHVQPGDVVLSGVEFVPKDHSAKEKGNVAAIRAVGRSLFTHAAIFGTRLGLLETNGPGQAAQISLYPTCKDKLTGDLLIDIGQPRLMVRGPKPAFLLNATGAPSRAQLAKVIASTVLAYLGHEYASSQELAAASRASRWLRAFDKPDQATFLRRWYCSSLVAQAYHDAGAPLLKTGVEMTPGKLSRLAGLEAKRQAVVKRRREDVEPLYGASAVNGAVSNTMLTPVIKNALATAARAGTAAAVAQLQADFDAAIAQALPEKIMLDAFEAQMIKAWSL